MSASSEPTTTGGAAVESAEATVTLPAHLHARPAGALAQAVATFRSTVLLEHGDRTVSPTGILTVMGLGARAGSTVTIRAQGPDALHAAQALARLLSEIE